MAKRSKRKNEQQPDLHSVTRAVNATVERPSHERFADTSGFKTSSVTLDEVRPPANQTSQAPRRKRVAGRSISFSVKLRADTLEYIYAIANERSIPLAQVIEELVEVHAHQQVANAKSTDTRLDFRFGKSKRAEQQHTVSGCGKQHSPIQFTFAHAPGIEGAFKTLPIVTTSPTRMP